MRSQVGSAGISSVKLAKWRRGRAQRALILRGFVCNVYFGINYLSRYIGYVD